MLKAALIVTIAFVAIISVGGTTVFAQAAQGGNVVIELEASADSVSFMKLNVNLDPFMFWPLKGGRSTHQELHGRRNASLPARSLGPSAGFLRADFLAPTSKVIGVTAMTRACAAS